jgi:WD40 repeat protein
MCAVSPDGAWVVSAGGFNDHTLKIWDSATGAVRATLTGHTDEVKGCAVSADGARIVSTSNDGTLRIWDAATGAGRAILVQPGTLRAMAIHPFASMVACGDAGGGVSLAHVVGIDFGPLVVTATAHGNELRVRCPTCQHSFLIEIAWLGSEISCPREGCATRLKVNSFVIQQPVASEISAAINQPASSDDEARAQIMEALRHSDLWMGVIRLGIAVLGVSTILSAPGSLFGAMLVLAGMMIITIAQVRTTPVNGLRMAGVSIVGTLFLLVAIVLTRLQSPAGWLLVWIWLTLQCFTFWYKNRAAATNSGASMRWPVNIYLALAIAAVAGIAYCLWLIFLS